MRLGVGRGDVAKDGAPRSALEPDCTLQRVVDTLVRTRSGSEEAFVFKRILNAFYVSFTSITMHENTVDGNI